MGNERDSDVKIFFTTDGKEISMRDTIEIEVELPEREYPKLIEEIKVTFVIKKTKNHYRRYMRWLESRKR